MRRDLALEIGVLHRPGTSSKIDYGSINHLQVFQKPETMPRIQVLRIETMPVRVQILPTMQVRFQPASRPMSFVVYEIGDIYAAETMLVRVLSKPYAFEARNYAPCIQDHFIETISLPTDGSNDCKSGSSVIQDHGFLAKFEFKLLQDAVKPLTPKVGVHIDVLAILCRDYAGRISSLQNTTPSSPVNVDVYGARFKSSRIAPEFRAVILGFFFLLAFGFWEGMGLMQFNPVDLPASDFIKIGLWNPRPTIQNGDEPSNSSNLLSNGPSFVTYMQIGGRSMRAMRNIESYNMAKTFVAKVRFAM
ncbi:hypothetical protein C8J57DRAFT_1259693 [Mycena rebaudengoi]|nr:hypothetical protein C8J57DRAFT_1259693 [Mycena rebaudengoi]